MKNENIIVIQKISTCKYYVLRYAEQSLVPHFGGGEKASVEIRG